MPTGEHENKSHRIRSTTLLEFTEAMPTARILKRHLGDCGVPFESVAIESEAGSRAAWEVIYLASGLWMLAGPGRA